MALSRPVLIVDETQEMQSAVLAELRLLSSAHLDSHILLTVVLAGDGRLVERLRTDEFLPLGSRMRVRLTIERATPEELREGLRHVLDQAGAPTLMSAALIATLCDHAQGNRRAPDEHGRRTARRRRRARRPPDRRDALLRDLCRAARRRDQDHRRATAMSPLGVQSADQGCLVSGRYAAGRAGGHPDRDQRRATPCTGPR